MREAGLPQPLWRYLVTAFCRCSKQEKPVTGSYSPRLNILGMFSLIQEVKITNPPPAGTPAMPSWPRPPQAMFSSKDVQGRPSTPAIKTVKPSGYPSKAGPQPVDGSQIPISGRGHRRYPCHPPWHLPPGVGLRSPQRPIQGHAIGWAGRPSSP